MPAVKHGWLFYLEFQLHVKIYCARIRCMLRKKKRRKMKRGRRKRRGWGGEKRRRRNITTAMAEMTFSQASKKAKHFFMLASDLWPSQKAQSLSSEEQRWSEGGRVRSLGKDGYGGGDVWVGGQLAAEPVARVSRLLFLLASFPLIEMHIFLPLEIYSSLPPASLEQALLFNFPMRI